MLPSIIRLVGIERIKHAVFSPLTVAKRTAPDPEKMPKIETPQAVTKIVAPPKIKTASAMDLVARNVGMFADDAAMLMLRSAARDGASVAAVPVMQEKIKKIDDPTYETSAVPSNVRLLLKTLGKVQ